MKDFYFETLFPISLGILFYGAFFYVYITKSKHRLVYKKFFRAVNSVLKENSDIDAITNQIKLNFKKLSEKNPNQKDILKNPYDLLEEMIFFIDTYDIEYFKRNFNIILEPTHRNKILEIIAKGKSDNPFISLPAKEANLLHNIKIALNDNNKGLGDTSLRQLADEIEITESNLRIQIKRNYSSYIVSIIGVILTIFFGILSLLSLVS